MTKNNQTQSWLDRPIVKGSPLNWEQALYIALILVCLVSRMAMLGYRVQSHDESLHTKFSWDLYRGHGYQHNPMMHGPFLFHATALSYLLFGDNDFSARLPVAIMGTLLVAFPYLLRRYLGRSGALTASFLILISPSITYYSRYIRMDIPSLLWAMIVIWSLLRYLEHGKDRHLYTLAAGLSLLYATKEVAAIYVMILAVFLLGLFTIKALQKSWARPEMETFFIAALIVAAVGLVILAAGAVVGAQPPPAEAVIEMTVAPAGEAAAVEATLPAWGKIGGGLALAALVAAGGFLLYGMGEQLRTLRSFDLLVVIGSLSLPFAAPLVIHLFAAVGQSIAAGAADPAQLPAFWSNLANLDMLNYHAPHIYYSGAILAVVIAAATAIGLLWDWRRWSIAGAIYLVIFLVFFTSVFTNGAGVASGWIGSVGYWLAQQEVERGGQPWFYYLVVLPFYDFLPFLGALIAPLYLLVRGLVKRQWRCPVDNAAAEDSDGSRPAPFIGFLVAWTLLTWLGYSYAGEKMPWLTVHIALPMILLSGWLVSKLLDAIDWQRAWKRQGLLIVLLLPALVAAVVSFLDALDKSPFQGVELEQLLVTGNLLGGLAGILLLGALIGWLWRRAGLSNGLLLAALSGLIALALLTVRIGYRFSFVNFDYPTEFLVYAHESGDVRTAMAQLEELSLYVGGGPELIDVTYGPEGSWPFYWYLRNYPNARFYGEQPSRDQVVATAIIAGQPQWDAVEPYLGDDYYVFDYVFLWWPMEDYRELTWTKFWEWMTDGEKRAALWQIFYHREYTLYDEITGKNHTLDDWPLHREFRLYVRKDVAAQVWNLGVGPVTEEDVVTADPYVDGWRNLTARSVWGAEGSAPGQLFWPRGIAVDDDGFVYVADSYNHRVQKFTADGQFVTAWGSYGNCGETIPAPATFCEPWDVAVGTDGTIFVADTWAHRIQQFTADGTFIAQWGEFGQYDVGRGPGYFYGPRSVVVSTAGEVLVSDTGGKRVQVFDQTGLFLRDWGGAGAAPGQLDEPVGIDVGPDGRVYVADAWNFRLQAFDADGTPLSSWPIAGWNNPNVDEKPYVAVDAEGQVYVTDPGHYRVLVFDPEGAYRYSFGQFGFDLGSFAMPMGIAVGPDGAIYVSDAANHRIMVFDVP
ncbi:MAG: TIGR03663 family protein [Anaerolineae bacterium]|nr:TIGR03663 family protein [Anaerolineae bacterium]